jgi:hypothetical protein
VRLLFDQGDNAVSAKTNATVGTITNPKARPVADSIVVMMTSATQTDTLRSIEDSVQRSLEGGYSGSFVLPTSVIGVSEGPRR